MVMRALETIIKEHPFFQGLAPEYLDLIAACGTNVRFNAGEFIFREGESADYFYLIRHGKVGLEIPAQQRGAITVETLGDGDVLGLSWLFPPYRWVFDARALDLTRAIALDGRCLRDKCDEDPALGYELIKRFSQIMVERLQATRLQIIDLYSHNAATP